MVSDVSYTAIPDFADVLFQTYNDRYGNVKACNRSVTLITDDTLIMLLGRQLEQSHLYRRREYCRRRLVRLKEVHRLASGDPVAHGFHSMMILRSIIVELIVGMKIL
ncbi:unnamed protein product [Ilex paraguariensis]|uniref:Uncharacterized protein n=1 Tax=Ilex paraguariensis TaxID=185542 RepID=A0ABC8UVX8_9AQUA